MADALQNFIDGKWVDAHDGARFDVFNPATGEVIATAPDSKHADVEAAVSAARRTFDEGRWWPDTTARDRGRILLNAADIVRREQERLATLESLDSGKPIGDAREDIAEVAFMFEYYGGWATKIEGDAHHMSADAMFMVWKEPMGVAIGITPWNYPLRMAAQKVAPALAAGCTFGGQDHHAFRRGHAEAGDAEARREVSEHRVRRRRSPGRVRGLRERGLLEPGRDLLGRHSGLRRHEGLRRRGERVR
jgi:aldehyde dehydrogenase family protein